MAVLFTCKGGAYARGYVVVRVDGVVVATGPNLIVTAGLAELAKAVVATDGFGATSWYIELGTGTTAVSASDTNLVTPSTATWRQASVVEAVGATATIETFYPTTIGNGTWTELGVWFGANSSVASGTMFARTLSSWTKTSSQVATVSWTVTFSVT
jgi:hypothetical protein